MEYSDHGVRLLNSAIIGVLSGSGVKLTPELGYCENRACEVWMFMYGKFTNHPMSEAKLTQELGPSLNYMYVFYFDGRHL